MRMETLSLENYMDDNKNKASSLQYPHSRFMPKKKYSPERFDLEISSKAVPCSSFALHVTHELSF